MGHVPEQLAAPALSVGSFVRISDVHVDVPLYWQCWRLNSPMVQTVTEAVWSSAANLRRYRKRLR
jgi:LysR family transcriptional regulator (chromosome initiation inhibitor)